MLYESIRNQQAALIAKNKAQIIITRKTRTADGAGGWTEATSTLASQDFRIYYKGSRVYLITDSGWHTARQIKLIAKYDADVEPENETFLDTFSYGDKDYKIKDVKSIYTQGYVVFKECALEELT